MEKEGKAMIVCMAAGTVLFLIFAGLILIGLIGLVTDFLFRILTRIVAPWHERLTDR